MFGSTAHSEQINTRRDELLPLDPFLSKRSIAKVGCIFHYAIARRLRSASFHLPATHLCRCLWIMHRRHLRPLRPFSFHRVYPVASMRVAWTRRMHVRIDCANVAPPTVIPGQALYSRVANLLINYRAAVTLHRPAAALSSAARRTRERHSRINRPSLPDLAPPKNRAELSFSKEKRRNRIEADNARQFESIPPPLVKPSGSGAAIREGLILIRSRSFPRSGVI